VNRDVDSDNEAPPTVSAVGVSVLKGLLLGLAALSIGLAAAIGVVMWWAR
jgi:hypothetical protein